MLQLVLGIAGAGKTAWLVRDIARRVALGEASILLVPEQYSSSAEAMVYHTLGDAGSALVEVASFRTLAARIFKTCGAPGSPLLSDAGRVVYLRRALDAVGDELQAYARHRRSTAFCQSCAEVLNEFKTAGATPAKVAEIGREADVPKLRELALVFEAYETLLAGAAQDPQDRVTLAAARADCGYFAGKALYVDNFDGFTAPEYAMLSAALAETQGVYVALCCDSLHEAQGGLGLFSPVRKTAARLRRRAEKQGVPIKAPIELYPPQGEADAAPYAVNRFVAEGSEPLEAEKAGLWLTNPADEWREVRLVAAEMRRLAGQGVPYSRMAVICRDLAAYESVVRHEFGIYGIPYYTDAVGSVEYTAPVAFIRAALALLRGGLQGNALLALLKTGLCGYNAEDIAALENYVFTWNPKAAEWRAPFTKDPGGLMASPSRENARQLARAEALRADVVSKIEAFLGRSRGRRAETLSRELYLLLDAMGAADNTAAAAARLEAAGETAMAAGVRRAWDTTMDLLDSMAQLLGSERLSADEYDELFLLLVRSTEFGDVPQTLECATFTAADRMRLDGPGYCFVLGLCEGSFPMQVGYSGLLTHADRDLLVNGGIEMPGSFENRSLLEEMVLYRALSSAHKGLYLSWPARQAGVQRSMSSVLEPLVEAFAPPPLVLTTEQMATTPQAAFALLGEEYRENTTAAATLLRALEGVPETPIRMLAAVENGPVHTVPQREVLHQLVGEGMQLSPTRAERYYECRFSYFMERVLGIRPRRKAELSPMESGTFVHHILEAVLREAGGGFAALEDEALAALAAKHADAFVAENLPDNSRRAAHLLHEVKGATAKLLCYLRDMAAQSGFAIDKLELPIADGEGAVPPLTLTTAGGEQVRVTGQIDRVDVLRQDGKTYLCVIDYKTGTKKFHLDEVYNGLNMQMLIYLHTLCKNGGALYPNAIPAGVLYLSGDPAPTSGPREAAGTRVYELDGILLNQPEVLRGLDRAGEGLFLPVRHKDGKPTRVSAKLADLEKLGRVGTHVEGLLREMAEGVYGGDFAALPLVKKEKRPCVWCGYRAVCRHEDGRHETQLTAPERPFEVVDEGGEGA